MELTSFSYFELNCLLAVMTSYFIIDVGTVLISRVVDVTVDEPGSASAVVSYGFNLSPIYHLYDYLTTGHIRFTQDVCSESNGFSVSGVSPSSDETYDCTLDASWSTTSVGVALAGFNIQLTNQILIKGLEHLQHVRTTILSDSWAVQLPENGAADATNRLSVRTVDMSCMTQDATYPFVSPESSDDTSVIWPSVAAELGLYLVCWCEMASG